MVQKTVAEYKKMFRYKIVDGEITITGYKGEDTDVVIPEKIGKATVVSIGDRAFSTQYETIKGPNEITIREQITSVVIPNTVKYIGKYAFDGCISLNKATIPENAYIDEGAFYETAYSNNSDNYEDGFLYWNNFLIYMPKNDNIKCVSIKKGTVNIGGNSMQGGEAIEIIKIPASVRVIGHKTFWGFIQYTPNLKEIEVDKYNEHYVSVDGVLYTKDMKTLIKYPSAKEGESFSVPDTVEHISNGAFHRCINLKSVTIPNGVKTIEYAAFEYARNLEKIVIPATVFKIGKYAIPGPSEGNVIIYTAVDSCAEQYALENKIKYRII